MEAARTELLRECGLSYRELEESGYYLPVREAFCRYRRGVTYDDQVIIESWLAQFHGASLVIEYIIFKEGEDENIIADGHTHHAFTDRNGEVGGHQTSSKSSSREGILPMPRSSDGQGYFILPSTCRSSSKEKGFLRISISAPWRPAPALSHTPFSTMRSVRPFIFRFLFPISSMR